MYSGYIPPTESPPQPAPPPRIPVWVPPIDTGQPPADVLNSLGNTPKATFAARNSIIPITYGRDRLFGKPFVVHVDEDAGFLYVAYGFCQGEIEGFETTFIDGVDVNADPDGFLLNAGAEVELHTGADGQSTSTLLSGILGGYTDTAPDTAYIVIKAPQGSTTGFPRLEAIVQGRKVYDPRLDDTRSDLDPVGSGDHRVDDVDTWEYSKNPTICFRDMVDNFIGWDIIDQGVVDLADYNDETIESVKRREIGLTLNKPSLVHNWVKGFRTYMGAFLGWEDNKLRVIPNRSGDDVAMQLTADDILKDSLKLTRRSLRSVPNSVAIDYEDSSGAKWTTERVQSDSTRVTSGDETRRLSRISLPGIHNASQAQREAIERLNWYLTDLEATLTVFDPGWELQNGSIVEVTHPIGLDAKKFRLRRITGISGRWTLDLVEYDPAIYSNEVIANPTTPDTNLGNPLSPPTVTNLNTVEELFDYRNGITGSRVRATWTGVSYPFFSQYLVEGYVGSTLVWQTTTQATSVVTPGVEELVDDNAVTYEVRVYTQSPFATGSAITDTVLIEGKWAIPGDVPQASSEVLGSSTVKVSWQEATDLDIWRYELRQGNWSSTWSTASVVDLVDGLTYTVEGLALGEHRFFVKAVDSVQQRSTNAVYTDVELLEPDPVTDLSGFEVASEVRLAWTAPAGYIARYRIAYDTVSPSSEITLDVVDTLRFQTKDVAEGTWKFLVYSIDNYGNECATADTIDIVVTSDAGAFFAGTYNFTSPTITTNLTVWQTRDYPVDGKKYYTTDMAEPFDSGAPPHDFIAGTPVATYHSSGASEWLSEVHDYGLALTGTWSMVTDVEALSGSVTIQMELSTDNFSASNDVYTTSAKGTYQYARLRILTTTTSTAFVTSPTMKIGCHVVPLEESGSSLSLTSGGKTITLDNEYSALKEVTVQPKNTQNNVSGVVDNIVIGTGVTNSFDVYIFDTFGQQLAEDFQWNWKAV